MAGRRRKSAELPTSTETGWPDNLIKKADAEISNVAAEIRKYYYRLVPLLRQIPYLALEADGRGGWSDDLGLAYECCIMPIQQTDIGGGIYEMFIELRSGELIVANRPNSHYVVTANDTFDFGGNNHWSFASDEEVFNILAHQDRESRFNPIKIIQHLRNMTNTSYHNSQKEVQDVLREKRLIKEKLNRMMKSLPPVMVRK